MIRNAFAVTYVLASLTAAAAAPAAEVSTAAGLQLEYVRYEEPGVMEEAGFLGGLFVETTARWDELMLYGFLSYVGGELYYDDHPNTGQDIDGYTPNTLLDVRATAGYQLAVPACGIIPFTGLGYRRLLDDLPNLDGARGYRREQIYLYVPLGIATVVAMQNGWVSEYRFEYDLFIEGRNHTLTERMTQDTGYGLRLAASFASPTMAFGPFRSLVLSIEPFIQYWNIDDSDVSEHAFYEPKNTSTMLGMRLAARF